MNKKNLLRSRLPFLIAVVAGTLWFGGPVSAAPDLAMPYRAIDPTMSDTTITLTGHDLTIEKLVQIARHGAKVQISAEAKQRTVDAYGLLLQGALENVPIYRFNRDSVLAQINTSDQNPAVVVGLKPEDSWELSTPQMMKYYVRGGKYSNGKSGYIVSNANWDPYPLANDIEYFTNALQNVGVAVALRLHRFNNPFFTVVTEEEVLEKDPQGAPSGGYAPKGGGFVAAGLWQDVQNVARPLSPEGFNKDMTGTEDLQAQTRLKAHNLRLAIDFMFDLMGQDLLTATYWLDLRKIEDPDRTFGDAPTAAWQAFRKEVPFRYTEENRPQAPIGRFAYHFLWENPASDFYAGGPAMPGGSGHIPIAMDAVME